MSSEENLRVLKEGADFNMKLGFGFGAINKFEECEKMTHQEYSKHYEQKRILLESLPWNDVKNPRNPRPDEYPTKDGKYITMLDCNEHAVLCNTFRDGGFLLYNKTHIKWWMPNPCGN